MGNKKKEANDKLEYFITKYGHIADYFRENRKDNLRTFIYKKESNLKLLEKAYIDFLKRLDAGYEEYKVRPWKKIKVGLATFEANKKLAAKEYKGEVEPLRGKEIYRLLKKECKQIDKKFGTEAGTVLELFNVIKDEMSLTKNRLAKGIATASLAVLLFNPLSHALKADKIAAEQVNGTGEPIQKTDSLKPQRVNIADEKDIKSKDNTEIERKEKAEEKAEEKADKSKKNKVKSEGKLKDKKLTSESIQYEEIGSEERKKLIEYLERRGSYFVVNEEKYLDVLIQKGKEKNIDVKLLLAITGQEVNFVPKSIASLEKLYPNGRLERNVLRAAKAHGDKTAKIQDAPKYIANNPFNVNGGRAIPGAWFTYNTSLAGSAEQACNLINDEREKCPKNMDVVEFINKRYAGDKKWHDGVKRFYEEMKEECTVDVKIDRKDIYVKTGKYLVSNDLNDFEEAPTIKSEIDGEKGKLHTAEVSLDDEL